jgi:hypothetical protein
MWKKGETIVIALLIVLLLAAVAAVDVTITVDWSKNLHQSTMVPTFQVVLNPLVQRGSKVHDNIWRYVSELDTDLIRFQAWLLFPKLVVMEMEKANCSTNKNVSWDFSYMDAMLADFMAATKGKVNSINFCTTPAWLWKNDKPVPYPTDPSIPDWYENYLHYIKFLGIMVTKVKILWIPPVMKSEIIIFACLTITLK